MAGNFNPCPAWPLSEPATVARTERRWANIRHHEDHFPPRPDACGRRRDHHAPEARQAVSIDTHDGDAVSDRPDLAAPTGGAIAWVSSNSGVHNILIADPTPGTGPMAGRTDHKWRAVTNYTGDDGLWITEPGFTSDAKTIVYVRGDGANRQGESPNPAQLQDGTDQAVFAVPVAGGTPKRLGPGSGIVGIAERPARCVGVARADLERRSRNHRCRRRVWSTRAAARRALRGRPTDRCSRSRAAAARTATSASSRSPRASFAISIPRSIATATRCGHRMARASRGSARARRRGRECFHRAATPTNRGRCASRT